MPPPEPAAGDAGRESRLLAGLCLPQVAGWSLAPIVSHAAPPLDVVEMFIWGREGVVATFKHPNLPGLVLEAARRVTGAVWPAYVISQVCVVAAFACVYALGRELLGRRRALAGTLLLTGVFYYSWPTPEMNHNLAQLPFWALIVLALWRAAASDRWLWWSVLGIAAGLVLWVKYTSGLLLLICGLWLLTDPVGRSRLRRPGPWLALALSLAVAAPQFHFLVASDFLPFDNALLRVTGVESDSWPEFLGAQGVAHAMFLIMAAVAGLFGAGATARSGEDGGDRARRFLTVLGLGPLALLCLVALIPGFGLRDMWAAPMFNLSGLLLLAWLPGRFSASALRRVVRFAAVLLILLPAAYAAINVSRPRWDDKPGRTNWPQAAIADHFADLFEAETGSPLRVVAGPPWEAGLIALTSASKPSVLLEGSFVRAPWVSKDDLARHGFLAVWVPELGPSESLTALLAEHGVTAEAYRVAEFRWSSRAEARPVAVGYAVVALGIMSADTDPASTFLRTRDIIHRG